MQSVSGLGHETLGHRRTHVQHAELGFADLLLTGACAGRLAVVLPVFPVHPPASSQTLTAVAGLLTRRHVGVDARSTHTHTHASMHNVYIYLAVK